MDVRSFLNALHIAERLKDTTRHSYTSKGRHESVAEHSWRIALMAFFLRDEFPEADMDKVMRMCLIHDLGEAFTGDIPRSTRPRSTRPPRKSCSAAGFPPCRSRTAAKCRRCTPR